MRASYLLRFLFVCSSELIEELASRRDIKIDIQVLNDESMIKFEDLSENFTPLQKNETIFTPFLYNKYIWLQSHNRNHCTTLQ